jgi:hypothetical protein
MRPFLIKPLRMPKLRRSVFSKRFGETHWLILERLSEGEWLLNIWGKWPHNLRFSGQTEIEAKEFSISLASRHLAEHGLRIQAVEPERWYAAVQGTAISGSRVVVSQKRRSAIYPFHSEGSA